MGRLLSGYRSEHREVVVGTDGEYQIDVTVRFEALGAEFLVLVECKYHKNPVKREVVQALESKVRSVGAHKGMIFSTSGFQSGAIEFAAAHGIAAIQIADGRSSYFTKAYGQDAPAPPWLPPIVAWLVGDHRVTLVSGGGDVREILEMLSIARLSEDTGEEKS